VGKQSRKQSGGSMAESSALGSTASNRHPEQDNSRSEKYVG